MIYKNLQEKWGFGLKICINQIICYLEQFLLLNPNISVGRALDFWPIDREFEPH